MEGSCDDSYDWVNLEKWEAVMGEVMGKKRGEPGRDRELHRLQQKFPIP